MKMKIALMYGKEDIRIKEALVPEINENEILIKVKSAAICGTDIRMYKNGHSDVNNKNPLALGHEVSGIIAETGKKVTGYNKGMRVAVAPNMGCGICRFCTDGNTHLCQNYQAFGININGGFAEYMKIPEKGVLQGNISILPDQVTYDEGALNEPLSCVYNGFTQYKVNPGDYFLVVGGGPIGIMHAKLAKMAGAAKVMINDLSKKRIEQAIKLVQGIIPVESEDINETIKKLTGRKGLNVCVIACSAPLVQSRALEWMDIGGRVNYFGGLTKDNELVQLNTNIIHYKQLQITGSTRASVSQYRKTLEFISEKIISVEDLVTARYKIDEIKEAIDVATEGSGIKTLIQFD